MRAEINNFTFRDAEFEKPAEHWSRDTLLKPENKDLKVKRGWSLRYRFGCWECVCISWDLDQEVRLSGENQGFSQNMQSIYVSMSMFWEQSLRAFIKFQR